jgi:nitrite transporter NirC
MAGFYIGIAVFLVHSVGAPLSMANSPFTKLIMGLSFSIGLTLVVFAGSELFTGNILFIGAGFLKRAVAPIDALRVLGFSLVGNLTGTLIFSYFIYCTGLLNGDLGRFIVSVSLTRVALGIPELIFRGIICNMLVCLALWMSLRASEEISKIIFIALCLFAFVSSGFLHSIADMALLALGILSEGGMEIGFGGYLYEVFFTVLGNIIGGFIIAAVYSAFGGETK